MEKSSTVFFLLYLIFSSLTFISCAPKPQSGGTDDSNTDILPKFIDQSLDYNAMMNNFRDFFMYLPVMMTSFRESMSGFPKFAEGIRILTSPTMEKPDDDCNCKKKALPKTNDIDKNMSVF